MDGLKLNKTLPLVSVILPAYNAESTILDAIDSILSQTYHNFELIVIDDGSTDSTKNTILGYNDSRIRFYSNEVNIGLIATLNRGINLSKGKYIARMDADDISLPDRLSIQLEYMESHPEVIVCGTLIKLFGCHRGRLSQIKFKKYSKDIKDALIIQCGFAHPTVMMRRSILVQNNIKYNPQYINSEDYKLWIDLSAYGEFHNIPVKLLKYRISKAQISSRGSKLQKENSLKCQNEYFEKIFNFSLRQDKISLKEFKKLRSLYRRNKYIIPYLYERLNKYTLIEFTYYLFSFDWIRLDRRENIIVLSKFIKKQ